MIDEPILITGAARSRTSLVAGIVHICGAWSGRTAGPTGANKKGMFELSNIRNRIMKPFLRTHGWDPMGQFPLPNIKTVHELAPREAGVWAKEILAIIAEEKPYQCDTCGQQHGRYKGETWMYKGAKMCLMWPIWHMAFPRAKWVIVRRNTEDIVISCLKTRFMRAFSNASGWQSWVEEHLRRFQEMHEAGLDIQEIDTDLIYDGDFAPARAVIETLGLVWKQKAIQNLIDRSITKRTQPDHGSKANGE